MEYLVNPLVKQAIEVKDYTGIHHKLTSPATQVGKLVSKGVFKMLKIPPSDVPIEELLKVISKVNPKKVDYPGLPLRINIGGSSVLSDIIRTWKNPNASIINKILVPIGLPTQKLLTSLFNLDHYDTNSHAVTIYHKSPAFLAHEIGHAMDSLRSIQKTNKSFPYMKPNDVLNAEYRATLNALKLLKNRRIIKELAPAFASYGVMDPVHIAKLFKDISVTGLPSKGEKNYEDKVIKFIEKGLNSSLKRISETKDPVKIKVLKSKKDTLKVASIGFIRKLSFSISPQNIERAIKRYEKVFKNIKNKHFPGWTYDFAKDVEKPMKLLHTKHLYFKAPYISSPRSILQSWREAARGIRDLARNAPKTDLDRLGEMIRYKRRLGVPMDSTMKFKYNMDDKLRESFKSLLK